MGEMVERRDERHDLKNMSRQQDKRMIEIHLISTTFIVLFGSGPNIQVIDNELLTPNRDLTG